MSKNGSCNLMTFFHNINYFMEEKYINKNQDHANLDIKIYKAGEKVILGKIRLCFTERTIGLEECF